MLNGPARHHSMAIYAVRVFCDAWEGFLFEKSVGFLTLKGNCEKWCAITKLECHVVWFHSARPTWDMIWKNIHYIWFSHFTLTETHQSWKYSPSLCISIKKAFDEVCRLMVDWQSKLSLKLLDSGRKIQNDVHIDTYYCKPELISWR